MSLRKGAGLLVALGLMAGLIQSGVAAQFTDSVIATQQNISVGTFAAESSAPPTAPSSATSTDWVTHTA